MTEKKRAFEKKYIIKSKFIWLGGVIKCRNLIYKQDILRTPLTSSGG